MKKAIVFLLSTLLVLAACGERTATPKAIFIIVDGIPADVIESVDTPNLDAIAAVGGYTRAYVGGEAGGASESPTISAVGYNSLLTGTWANKHNVWDNDVADPNYAYWDIFRIAKNFNPSLKTAIYSTWTDNRTRLVGDGLPEAGGKKIDFHADGYELDEVRFPHDEHDAYIGLIDDVVVDEAVRHLGEQGPDLSWVYLENTDGISHEYGDSPEFYAAVEHMDQQIGRIWKVIEERQAAYAEDWLLIVTTDHGRDAETGMDHGGQTERERTTWIVTNSKRLNDRFNEMPGVVDILPSIAKHMNIAIPAGVQSQLDGQSFID
jgi:predicted AlkP superfamily pyrophosphatase or phosphodiesterase